MFLAAIVLSCGYESSTDLGEANSHRIRLKSESVWVCHNPESKFHQSICHESCLEPGNQNSFCWLLRFSDCAEPLEQDWQRQNCHLLED